MADATAILPAYHRAGVASAPVKDYEHLSHIAPELIRETARAMNIPFVQIVERGRGIKGDDRYRITLTCSNAQHIWFREIHFQRAMIATNEHDK